MASETVEGSIGLRTQFQCFEIFNILTLLNTFLGFIIAENKFETKFISSFFHFSIFSSKFQAFEREEI